MEITWKKHLLTDIWQKTDIKVEGRGSQMADFEMT